MASSHSARTSRTPTQIGFRAYHRTDGRIGLAAAARVVAFAATWFTSRPRGGAVRLRHRIELPALAAAGAVNAEEGGYVSGVVAEAESTPEDPCGGVS